MRSAFARPFLPALAVLALVACQPDEAKLAEHMTRGDAYLESEEYPEAIIEYKNVLQIDPNHAAAHYGLARAYLKNKQAREGFWELRETVRLDDENHDAKLQFGQISIYAGDLDEALRQADEVIEADPERVEAHLLRGEALEALKRPDEARAAYEKGYELGPENRPALLMLANFHRRRGDREAAEPLFRKLAEIYPDFAAYVTLGGFLARDRERDEETIASYTKALEVAEGEDRTGAHAILAGFYFGRDRFDEAVAQLERGIEEEGQPLELIYLLARFHRSAGNEAEANALIEKATRARPNDAKPYLILSRYRARQGDLEGSLEAAQKAVEIDPEHERAQLRLAEVLVEIGHTREDPEQIAKGRVMVEGMLAREPSHPGALFVKAKIDVAEGKFEDAITALRAAIDTRPDWAQAHFVLGNALVLNGERSAARTELARALEIDPTLVDARRVLARVHADLGEHEYAVEEGRRFLRERPDDVPTRILVAQSLVNTGRIGVALRELNQIPEEKRDPAVHFAMGRVYLGKGQLRQAREHLEKAAEGMSTHAEILRSLMILDRQQNRFDESIERIAAALQAEPENPRLHVLQGNVERMRGNPEAAEASFKRAIELDPSNLEAYQQLATFYGQAGRLDEAIQTYTDAVELSPEQPQLHHFLGVLYEMGGKSQKAIESYEAAIRYKPDLAESKNNLAYLFAEREENLDRALDLAQEAKALLPDNPNTADTLGWVLYRRGIPSAAISYLKEAEAGIDPGDANIGAVRHHLALAYEANGDTAEARQALERALAGLDSQTKALESAGGSVAEPAWAVEARSMLDRLKAASSGG